MAVVYAARHLVSGRTRALKIARTEDAAEEALRGEYQVLSALDHPNVVRVIDLTKMVEGRLTLVMERVGGETLRQWMALHPTPGTDRAASARRRPARRPRLPRAEVDHPQGPQARQPARQRWQAHDHRLQPRGNARGCALRWDRSLSRSRERSLDTSPPIASPQRSACSSSTPAATPSKGESPSLAKRPSVRDDDIQPSGLCAFFRKALDPTPEKRFPSARAMRDALLVALGEDVATTVLRSALRAARRDDAAAAHGAVTPSDERARALPGAHGGRTARSAARAGARDPRDRHQDRQRHHRVPGGAARPRRRRCHRRPDASRAAPRSRSVRLAGAGAEAATRRSAALCAWLRRACPRLGPSPP